MHGAFSHRHYFYRTYEHVGMVSNCIDRIAFLMVVLEVGEHLRSRHYFYRTYDRWSPDQSAARKPPYRRLNWKSK